MHAYIQIYIHTYLPTTYLRTYIGRTYIHTHTHIHTCIHAYVHAQRSILKLAYLLYLHCLGALRRKAWAQGLQRLRAQWVTDAETRSAQLRRGQPHTCESLLWISRIYFLLRGVSQKAMSLQATGFQTSRHLSRPILPTRSCTRRNMQPPNPERDTLAVNRRRHGSVRGFGANLKRACRFGLRFRSVLRVQSVRFVLVFECCFSD